MTTILLSISMTTSMPSYTAENAPKSSYTGFHSMEAKVTAFNSVTLPKHNDYASEKNTVCIRLIYLFTATLHRDVVTVCTDNLHTVTAQIQKQKQKLIIVYCFCYLAINTGLF